MSLALWLSLLLCPASAQTDAAPKTELGRPVVLKLETPATADLDLERTTTDYFSLAVKDKRPQGDKLAWTLELVPLSVGELSIPIYWKGAPDASVIRLSVSEPTGLEPNAELHDIKSPVRARPALWPWALLALAAAAAWYWWRNRKPGRFIGEASRAAPDTRTADQIAKDELAALEASDLWPTGHYKEFYGRLTDVLRAYIERRLGMPALKLTTHELARLLRAADLERETVSLFKTLFERADLVKFAKTQPASEQGGLDVASARKFVDLTSPRDMASAPGGQP